MARVSSVPKHTTRWNTLLNTLIVVGGTLLSRVLGLLRETIFSNQFGTNPDFGVFRASFSVLDLLYLVIIGGALGSSFIPVFGSLIEKKDDERAWKLANTVLTVSIIVFAVVALVVGVFAQPLLAATVVRGYAEDLERLGTAVVLLRLMLVQPLLLGVAGLMMAMLQTFNRFTLPIIGYNLYNLMIIVFAGLFAPRYGINALAAGVVCGAAIFLVTQVWGAARLGLRFQPTFDWRMPEVRRVGQLLGPRLVGQSASQINLIVMFSLLSLIGAAAQAANGYATMLLMLPQGIIATSIGTVMFPRLARLFGADQIDDVRRVSIGTLRTVLWLMIPIAALFLVLHVPIVRLLFQRGEFTDASLALTSRALLFYSIAVIGLGGGEIITRTFYAMQDTRTPVMVGLATITCNALLAWLLIQYRRDIGLVALAYSICHLAQCLTLGLLLRRRLRQSRATIRLGATRHFMLSVIAGTIALLAFVLAAWWLGRDVVPGLAFESSYQARQDFLPLAGWLAAVGMAGMGLYIAVSAMMRLPEVYELWSLLRRRRAA